MMLKQMAARFPAAWQQELKRHYYAWQIRRGRFRTHEREFQRLDEFVSPGDWAIDVGANVGHYTAKLSKLVGPGGRVLALEPVPKTFELLAQNARRFPFANVTLLNLAASDRAAILGMEVPDVQAGTYLAHVTEQPTGLQILSMPLDSFTLPQPVRLVKIDAEGHELSVLRGMTGLLHRDWPALIVEVSSDESTRFLTDRGYEMERMPGSPNCVFRALPA
jgi:FkbM family methyltransferase